MPRHDSGKPAGASGFLGLPSDGRSGFAQGLPAVTRRRQGRASGMPGPLDPAVNFSLTRIDRPYGQPEELKMWLDIVGPMIAMQALTFGTIRFLEAFNMF
jgi:hypothetical protein